MPSSPGIDDATLARVYAQHAHLCSIGLGHPREPLAIASLRALIEATFWASLRSDEGRPTRVRISVAPAATAPTYQLHEALPFTEETIARLAPAVPARGVIVAT